MMKTATTECTVETGQDIQKLFLEYIFFDNF